MYWVFLTDQFHLNWEFEMSHGNHSKFFLIQGVFHGLSHMAMHLINLYRFVESLSLFWPCYFWETGNWVSWIRIIGELVRFNLDNHFNFHVCACICPSVHVSVHPCMHPRRSLWCIQILNGDPPNHKISLIRAVWYISRRMTKFFRGQYQTPRIGATPRDLSFISWNQKLVRYDSVKQKTLLCSFRSSCERQHT